MKREITIFALILAILAGTTFVLVGGLVLYHNSGWQIASGEPREPDASRILADVRSGFQDFSAPGAVLSPVTEAIRVRHQLHYLDVQSPTAVRLASSHAQDIEDGQLEAIRLAIESNERASGDLSIRRYSVQVATTEEGSVPLAVIYAFDPDDLPTESNHWLNHMADTTADHMSSRFASNTRTAAIVFLIVGTILILYAMIGIRRVRRVRVQTEMWPDRARPVPTQELEYAIHEDGTMTRQATGQSEQADLTLAVEEIEYNPQLTDEQRAALRAHQDSQAPLPSEEAYEFEQERWNLPGFQSVLAPVRKRIDADDVDLTDLHFMYRRNGAAFQRDRSLFDHRFYRYEETGEFPESVADIESFSRSFLEILNDRASNCTITLYFRNRRGQYLPVMRRDGALFVSGAALEADDIAPDVLKQLEGDNFVMMDEGESAFFPLPSQHGMLGAVHLAANRSLYDSNMLSDAWYEIRKFGSTLLQARVYEQATIDPESTLGNGLAFHHELKYDFALKREVRFHRQLTLIRFQGRSNPESVQLFGLSLRAVFGFPNKLYRIAADALAILGPRIEEEDLERRLGQFLGYLRKREAADLCVGVALLTDDVVSPNDWFRRAGRALEECEAEGVNRFRMFQPAGEKVSFTARH